MTPSKDAMTKHTSSDELFLCQKCLGKFSKDEMEKESLNHRSIYCFECRRKKNQESYIRNRKNRLAKYLDYKRSDRGRVVAHVAAINANKRSPEKALARSRLRYAVKTGRIVRDNCEVCNSPKVEAHHYLGYEESHWYDVMWLCRNHHRDEHKFSLESRGLI